MSISRLNFYIYITIGAKKVYQSFAQCMNKLYIFFYIDYKSLFDS